MERFVFSKTHLQHFIGDELRATIAIEHLAEYRQFVPHTPEAPIEAAPADAENPAS